MRKFIVLTLFVVVIISILFMQNTFAVISGTCGDNLTWELDDDEGTLTILGEGEMYDYFFGREAPWYLFGDAIKNIVIGNNVTRIGDWMFYGCTNLTSITIPDSVTSIGDDAFYGCSNLTSITIHESVTSIGEDAFRGTAIYNNKDNWENGVLYIGKHLIEAKTTLTSHTIKSGTITIADRAFCYCEKLMSVTIPDSVTNIGNEAFTLFGHSYTSVWNEYSNIENIYITDIKAWMNINFSDEYSNPLNGGATLNLNNIPLTKIVIPDGVTDVKDYVFYNCDSINSVIIPESVKNIGRSAFYRCNSLTNVYVTDIEAWMNINFEDEYSNPLTNGAYLYLDYKMLTHLVVPDGVEEINSVFRGCHSLISVTISDNVTNIGDSAFRNCDSLTSVQIGNGTKIIGDWAFYNCESLTNVSFSDGVKSIGEHAFAYCDELTSVVIPDSVISIGDSAFYNCNNMKSVTIGDNVTSIGDSAFYGCNALRNIVIPDSVISIGDSAFYNCYNMTSVTIGDNITSIGYSAFYNCNSLTSITIPNSVTSIGNSAFSGCDSLTSVQIGNGVKSIGEYAFSSCTRLMSITIPDSVTSIGEHAFSNTVIDNNKENWEDGGLYLGKHLIEAETTITSYAIKDGTITIADRAFYNCDELTSVEIPDSVISIGDSAFSGCDSLTSVQIGNGVKSIGNSAFWYCWYIEDVYYGGTEEEFKNIEIDSGNDELIRANVYYKCDGMPLHISPSLTQEDDCYLITLKADVDLPEMKIYVAGYDENGVLIAIKEAESNEAEFDASLSIEKFIIYGWDESNKPLSKRKTLFVESSN